MMHAPQEPCRICGYGPLERGPNLTRSVDSSETECPRCLAQFALDDEGRIEFMFDLPGVPLPREQWRSVPPGEG